ncbi:MAG: class I SAM-dependent methyltransferase [Pirellulaceae bacterium]
MRFVTLPNGTCSDGIEFCCADALNTGLDNNSVDVVVSFETLEHVPHDEQLIAEFLRILKPGGLLICSTPNQWPLEIAPYHVKEYDLKEFKRVLETQFSVVEMFNQNSGTAFQFNREQGKGVIPTTEDNQYLAECFVAVAQKH